MVAFDEPNYGEMVLHPPPLSSIAIFMVLFVFFDKKIGKIAVKISLIIFWLENIAFLICFSILSIAFIPLVLIKILYNILRSGHGLFSTILYSIVWVISGIFITSGIAGRDVYYLYTIFKMHDGCRAEKGIEDELKEEPVDKELLLRVYNEVRECIIEIYLDFRK